MLDVEELNHLFPHDIWDQSVGALLEIPQSFLVHTCKRTVTVAKKAIAQS